MHIDRIEGTIYLKDAENGYLANGIHFVLDDQTWEQFGVTRAQLVAAGTSALLERLQQALAVYMLEEGEGSPSND